MGFQKKNNRRKLVQICHGSRGEKSSILSRDKENRKTDPEISNIRTPHNSMSIHTSMKKKCKKKQIQTLFFSILLILHQSHAAPETLQISEVILFSIYSLNKLIFNLTLIVYCRVPIQKNMLFSLLVHYIYRLDTEQYCDTNTYATSINLKMKK